MSVKIHIGKSRKRSAQGKQMSWATNVLKSLGYSSKSLVESMIPSTMELVSNNAETVTEMLRDMRSMKMNSKRLMGAINDNDYIKIANEAIANAKEDLKSGKLHNNDRIEKMADTFGDDLDFDFGGDDNSFSFERDEDGSSVTIHANITEDNPMVQATRAQTEAIVATAEANQKAQLAIANTQMIADKRMMDIMQGGFATISENLGQIVTFQSENMSKFTAAAISYYGESIGYLKTIAESMGKMSKAAEIDEKRQREDPLEAVLSNGFSLSAYGQLVKKQLAGASDSNMFIGPIKSMLSDKETLKLMAANPLSFIPTMIVGKLLPEFFQKSMERLDQSIKEFFPAVLTKIGGLRNSQNPILQFFGEVFGISGQSKSRVDLGRYAKGPTPFDGQTKYAIVNVIPAFLSKILSALNGKDEMVIDWKTGTLKDRSSMRSEWKRDLQNERLAPINDIVSEVEQRIADRFRFSDEKEAKKLKVNIRELFEEMMKSDEFINFNRYKDADGFAVNDLKKLKDIGDNELKVLREIIRQLPYNKQMRLMGGGKVESRARVKKYLEDMETGQSANNAFAMYGDQSNASILTYDVEGNLVKDNRGRIKLNRHELLGGADKYGKAPTDYLRDIRSLLLKGIMVFPQSMIGASGSGHRGRGQRGGTSGGPTIPSHLQRMRDEISRERSDIVSDRFTPFDEVQITASLATNRMDINSMNDLADYTPEEIAAMVAETPEMYTTANNGGVARSWKERWGRMKQRFSDIVRSPATLLAGLFDRVDKAMYNMIFTPDKDGQRSFFGKIFDGIQVKLEQGMQWLDARLIQPIREFLFEGPNSLKERFKNSKFYDWMGKKKDSFVEFLLGVKGPDGTRSNGLFSGVWNNMNLIGMQFRHQITGAAYTDPITGEEHAKNEDSVFSHFGNIMKDYGHQVKSYLFGDRTSSDPDKKDGVLSSGFNAIKQGFQSFGDAIFGHRKDKDGNRISNVDIDGFTEKLKKHAPKALAVGIVGAGLATLNGLSGGLLPTLFLPTGPIGGALLGTTLSFLTQSDKFMNFVFGAKDAEGVRLGGLVSKQTQEFFKKHKTALIGGATIGTIKGALGFNGLGIMSGLLGGPIAGAVLGLGASLLTRSESFKNMMFGEEIDGKRAGGLVGKITSQFKDKDGKNTFGKIGAGALGGATLGWIASKFGLVGSMMLGGGPLMGALMGIAGGLALTNEKWKKALFGEFDEDKQIRKGGVFGKFINWTKLEIFEPIKLKFAEINIGIRQWFEESIANPFKDALAPIKYEFQQMVENMKEMFAQGWKNFTTFLGNTFKKYVGAPFGKVMEEKVLKPLKGFFNKLIKGTGMIIGGILSAPFKAMSSVAMGLQGKHEHQGVQNMRNNAWDVLTNKDGKGEGIGLGERFFGVLKAYFGPQTIESAKSEGAPYRDKLKEDKAKRDQATKDKYNKEREKFGKRRDEWNRRRGKAKEYDYDNVAYDENGNEIDVSSNYDIRSPEDRANAQIAQATLEDGTIIPVVIAEDGTVTPAPIDDGSSAVVADTSSASGESAQTATLASPTSEEPSEPAAQVASVGESPKKGKGHGRSKKGATVSTGNKGRRPNKPLTRTASPIVASTTQPSGSAQVAEDTASTPAPSRSASSSKGLMDKRSKILSDISTDVRNIAAEVNGQLDGVGSNVYKIRKIVQGQAGIEDEDLTGSANRDRKGLWGKFRAMLYRPFDSIVQLIRKPFQKIADVMSGIKDRVVDFGKFVISLPKKFFQGLGRVIGDVYEGFKLLGKSLLVIPTMIADGLKAVLSIGVEAVKAIGPMIGEALKGVGEVIHGIGSAIKFTIVESVKGTMEVFRALSGAAKNLITGFASLLPSAFGFIKDTMTFVGDTIVNVAKGAITGIFELFKAGFSILGFPIKLLAGGATNLAGKALGFGISSKVQISGADKSIPVHLTEGAGLSQTVLDKLHSMMKDQAETIAEIISGGKSGSPSRAVRRGLRRGVRGAAKRITSVIRDAANNPILNDETAATLTALQAHDADDDKEEAAKEQAAKLAEEQEARHAEVTDQTAAARIAQLDEAEKEKIRDEQQAQIAENTRRAAEAAEDHGSSWKSILGKKGLLFLGAMGLFFAVKKFLKNFKMPEFSIEAIIEAIRNAFKNEEGRTDGEGNVVPNSNADETLTKATVKVGVEALESVGKSASKAGKTLSKIPGVSNIVTKAKAAVKRIVDVVVNFVKKKFDSAKATKVGQVIQGIFNKVFTPKTVAEHSDKVAKAAAKDGSKATSLGVIAGIFAIYDGISGAYEARRFFRVPNDSQVTVGMRAVSAIIKILTELSAVTSLGITLAEEFLGLEIRRNLSMTLLKIFDRDGAAAVEEEHARFEKELAQYNKDNKTKLTEAAWNDMQNKTMFQDIVNSPKAIVDGIKNFGAKVGNKIKGGWNSYEDTIRRQLGLSDDADIGFGQHLSSFGGNAIWALTLGMADRKKMAQHIESFRSNFTRGMGDFAVAFGKWADGIPEWFQEFKSSVDKAVGIALGMRDENGNYITASQWFKNGVSDVKKNIKNLIDAAKKGFKTIGEKFDKAISAAGKWISEKLGFDGMDDPIKSKQRMEDRLQFFQYQIGDLSGSQYQDAYNRRRQERLNAGRRQSQADLQAMRARYHIGESAKGQDLTVTDYERASILQTDLEKRLKGVKDYRQRDDIIRRFRESYKGKENASVISEAINRAETRNGQLTGSGSGYFSQNDPRWRNKATAGGTMGDLGCGPTAMAMVGSAMGRRVNPATMQDFANQTGFATNRGVNANYIAASANAMGLESRQILGPGARAISDSVQRGPVVLLGRNNDPRSPYTSGGHYVVAKKGSSRGTVQIMDPRGAGRNKVIPITALGGTMAAWEFGAGNTAGERVAEKMMSLEKKLTYTQYPGRKVGASNGNRAHIEKGFGDCSSTVQWCYKTTVGVDPGATTAQQITRGVEVIRGGERGIESKQDVIARLKPGDLIIYGNKGGGTTHVEMYVGDGKMMGHGDTKKKGPQYHDMKTFWKYMNQPCISIRRYVDDAGNALNPGDRIPGGASYTSSPPAGSEEGLTAFGALAKMAGVFATAIGRAVGILGDEEPISADGVTLGGSPVFDFGSPARISDPSAQSTIGTDPTNKQMVRTRKLTDWKPISAAQINEFIEGKVRRNPANAASPFRGQGQVFVDVGKQTGLDPRYILAHAAWESAWGLSRIAKDKGNYFGIGAFNDSPYASAKEFKNADGSTDIRTSISYGADWIRKNYTDAGDDSLYKMIYTHAAGPYAVTNGGQPSDSWIDGISSIMAEMGGMTGAGKGIGKSLSPKGFQRTKQPITTLYPMQGAGDGDIALVKEMIEVLRSIDRNTGGSKLATEALLSKYRPTETTIVRSGDVNVDARRTGRSGRETSLENDTRRVETYAEAKRIAKGKLA